MPPKANEISMLYIVYSRVPYNFFSRLYSLLGSHAFLIEILL